MLDKQLRYQTQPDTAAWPLPAPAFTPWHLKLKGQEKLDVRGLLPEMKRRSHLRSFTVTEKKQEKKHGPPQKACSTLFEPQEVTHQIPSKGDGGGWAMIPWCKWRILWGWLWWGNGPMIPWNANKRFLQMIVVGLWYHEMQLKDSEKKLSLFLIRRTQTMRTRISSCRAFFCHLVTPHSPSLCSFCGSLNGKFLQ